MGNKQGSCSCRRVIDLLYSDGKAGDGWMSQKEAARGERCFDEARLTAACRQCYCLPDKSSFPLFSEWNSHSSSPTPFILFIFSYLFFLFLLRPPLVLSHFQPFSSSLSDFTSPPLSQLCQLLASVVLLLLKRTRFCHWCFSLSPPKRFGLLLGRWPQREVVQRQRLLCALLEIQDAIKCVIRPFKRLLLLSWMQHSTQNPN